MPVKSRREQLLSGKFRETPSEKHARVRRENLEVIAAQKARLLDRYKLYFDLIQNDNFLEWYQFTFYERWPKRYNDDPISGIAFLHTQSLRLPHLEIMEHQDREDMALIQPSDKTSRQMRMEHATPCWANKRAIKLVYDERDRLNKKFPHLGPFDVDHIIPIMGRFACGLHVHFNMQVLPKKENMQKSNKMIDSLIKAVLRSLP